MEETNNQQLILLDDSDKKKAVPMAVNEKEGVKGTITAYHADPMDLRLTVKVGVMKAYIHHQRATTKKDLSLLINDLTAEILRAYGSIRLEEIGLAIHKTAMGEFDKDGKVYNLSMAFFASGIRTYMNSEVRVQAVRNMLSGSERLLLAAPKPTEEDIQKARIKIIKKAYDDFRANGHYNDVGNYVFETLANYGVVNFTEADKIDMWKLATSNVIRSLTVPARTIDERNINRALLKDVQANKDHPVIFTEAKKIALKKFFSECKEMGVEMYELIEA